MSAVTMEKELTTVEVARRLQVHRLTVIRRIEAGLIRARKEGGEWRIKESELARYIESTYRDPQKEEDRNA